jgi:hypothetical protein
MALNYILVLMVVRMGYAVSRNLVCNLVGLYCNRQHYILFILINIYYLVNFYFNIFLVDFA